MMERPDDRRHPHSRLCRRLRRLRHCRDAGVEPSQPNRRLNNPPRFLEPTHDRSSHLQLPLRLGFDRHCGSPHSHPSRPDRGVGELPPHGGRIRAKRLFVRLFVSGRAEIPPRVFRHAWFSLRPLRARACDAGSGRLRSRRCGSSALLSAADPLSPLRGSRPYGREAPPQGDLPCDGRASRGRPMGLHATRGGSAFQ